jgi:hypothetical protein
MRVALFVLAAIAVLSLAELTSAGFNEFTRDYPLIATFITEAVLLAGVYLVIDEIIQRRETRRWSDVTSLGVRALSTRAHEPARIVREAVGAFAVETGREPPEVSASAADYEGLVDRHAEELESWLRADNARASSFARAMRQGASGLEEAIVRWGPTLVEDPDSAEVINLLPDVVDAARSAASCIAPASGRFDRAGSAGRWTDADRESFADSLIAVLRNEDEFHERLSRRTS